MDRLNDSGSIAFSGRMPAVEVSTHQAKTLADAPGVLTGDSISLSMGKEKDKHRRIRHDLFQVHDSMEAVHVGTEIGAAFQLTGKIAAAASLGTVAAGLYFGYEGIHDVRSAIAKKDLMAGIESAGHLSLASEAALSTAKWATQSSAVRQAIGTDATALINSPAASTLGKVFGVGHGLAEIAVGTKEVIDGRKAGDKKEIISGLLDMAIGGTVAALALVPGIPGAIALAALFAARMFMSHHS
jgi:hypothetical protein